MTRYISGRVPRVPQTSLTQDRYSFLSLNQSEPNLGDPLASYDYPGTLPVGQQYQIVSVVGYPGQRYWIPVSGGLIPGSISVFDENFLVGSANSITQLNFVGAAVSATAVPLGIAATIRIFAPGSNSQILFNLNNEFSTSSNLTFSSNTLSVIGFGSFSGIVTTGGTNSNGIGIGTTTNTIDTNIGNLLIKPNSGITSIVGNLVVSGVSTFGGNLMPLLSGTQNIGAAGSYWNNVYANNFVGRIIGNADTATYAYTAGVSTNVIGGIGSITQLYVAGISTFANGPVLINTAPGTSSQSLQVTGGAYVSGNLGVGNANPTSALWIVGDGYFSGVVTAVNFIGNLTGNARSASYASTSGLSTSVIGGIGSITQLYVSGISTFANGPVFISTTTSTGTSNQPLQVGGGAYVNGNLGIGIINPSYKLDVNGTFRYNTGIINDNFTCEKTFDTNLISAFANGVANQAFDVRIGNISVWGYIEIEITGTFAYQNTPGILRKIFSVGTNPNNNIYTNQSRVAEAMGAIVDNISIGEFQWDAANSTYKVPISHIVSTGNDYVVKVRAFTYGQATTLYNNLSLSSVYTLTALSPNDITYPTRNVLIGTQTVTGTASQALQVNSGAYVRDNVGIGTTNPAYKLDVYGNGHYTGNLTVDGTVNATINGSTTQIIVTADTSTSSANYLTFVNGTSTGAYSLRDSSNLVYIPSSGNLGIGALSPATKLDVNGTITARGSIIFQDANNTNTYGFRGISGIITLDAGSVYPSGWNLQYGNSSSSALYINSSGNIGIGTTNPAYKLDIYGTGHYTGNLTVDGNVTLGDANTDTVTFNARVNTSILPSTNGTLDLGSTSQKWNNIYSNTIIGAVTGNADTATKLQTARTISATSDISWSVSFDGSTNATAAATLAASGVAAATYGSSTQIPVFDVDAKGRVTSVTNTGINFSTATVAQSDTVKTISNATNASFYPTFVTRNNSSAAYESVYTDAGISYNPSTDKLSISGSLDLTSTTSATPTAILTRGADNNFQLTAQNGAASNASGQEVSRFGINYSGSGWNTFLQFIRGGGATDGSLAIYTNNTSRLLLDSSGNLLPQGTSGTLNLGGTSNRWNTVYATTFNGAFQGNADTASQVAVITNATNASFYPTFVTHNNSSAANESVYTDAGISYNPSTNLLSIGGNINLGSDSSGATATPYNINLGNTYSNGTTRDKLKIYLYNSGTEQYGFGVGSSGDIQHHSNATHDFYVSNTKIVTINNAAILPQGTSGTLNLGGVSNYWNNVYANTFVGAITGNASTATKLATARSISASSDIAWSVSFDGSTDVTAAATLATVNSNTGIFGSTTTVPQITVDGKGRITAVSNQTISSGINVDNATNAGIATNLKGGIASQIPYQTAANTTAFIPNGTTGQLLQSNGISAPSWVYATGLSVNYAATAGVATNLSGTTTNSIPYQSASSTTTYLSPPSSGSTYILTSSGGAPSWSTTIPSSTVAAGSNTQVQYNSSGSLGASANFTFNSGTNLLAVTAIKPGQIQDSSGGTGTSNYVLTASGSGGWSWQSVTSIGGIGGISVQQGGTPVGTTGGITTLNFSGATVTASTSTATITIGGNITVTETGYACTYPISASGSTLTIGSNSNAYGTKYVQSTAPASPCDGDVWYDTSGTVATGGEFPSGTVLLFHQTSAPTGWSQVMTHNDKVLRVVTGTGGGSGGSTAFTSVFASRTVPLVDHNHSITDPGHFHNTSVNAGTGNYQVQGNDLNVPTRGYVSYQSDTKTTGITVNNASATQTTGNTMDFAVQYIDIILCSKN